MANARWDSNVTALQAETTQVNGEVALLAGYTTPGDGGGGMLYFTTPTPTGRQITNATNATPIVVTTATTHTFVLGQRIMIGGVAGNLAANGTWLVAAPTTTQLTLHKLDGTNSVGSGAYTSGGAIGDGGGTIPSGSATQGIWTRIL
jgi:hypothetical protein